MPRAACWAPVTAKRYLDLATKVRTVQGPAARHHHVPEPSLMMTSVPLSTDHGLCCSHRHVGVCAVACVVCVSGGCMLQEGLDDMFSSDLTGEELGQRLGHVSVPTLLAFSAAGNRAASPFHFISLHGSRERAAIRQHPYPSLPFFSLRPTLPPLSLPACRRRVRAADGGRACARREDASGHRRPSVRGAAPGGRQALAEGLRGHVRHRAARLHGQGRTPIATTARYS